MLKEVRMRIELFLAVVVTIVLVFLTSFFFPREASAPARAEKENKEALIRPIRVEYSPDLAFFDQKGEPLIWYYRNPEGKFELFRGSYQAPMIHPRYSDVDLFAVTPTVVREIEAAFGEAPRTTSKSRRPTSRTDPLRVEAAPPLVAREARILTIPAETLLEVTIDRQLSTKTNKTGDTFGARLTKDLVFDGETVLEQGTKFFGRIAELKQPGRFKGVAKLTLVLDRIGLGGDSDSEIRTLPLQMSKDPSRGKDVLIIGGSAGAGAIVGAVTGGGSGAAKGGILGGVGGVIADVFTKGEDLELSYQAPLTFTTAANLTVTKR